MRVQAQEDRELADPVAFSGDVGTSLYRTRVAGKVFYKDSNNGSWVCSASIVNSPARNMVFTAGHCVHEGDGGNWHNNWLEPAGRSDPPGHWRERTTVKPLHIALVVVAAAAIAGVFTFLLVGNDDKPSASQPTSTTLPSSSPGAGWTEEEMRNARPRDTTVGPSVETLAIGGAALAAGATTAAVLLVKRRRSH